MKMTEELFSSIEVKGWNDLYEELIKFDGSWVFRGQSNQIWKLMTTLDRENYENPKGAERLLISNLLREIHNFENESSIPKNNLEALSYLQHFGAPTRLLDVTHSPFIALYFAMNECREGNAVVYCINYHKIMRNSYKLLVEFNSDKIHRDVLTEFEKRGFDICQPAIFDHIFFREEPFDFVATIAPFKRNRRMAAQQASFLCQSNLNASFEQNLRGVYLVDSEEEPVLMKIVVPNELRMEIMSKLDKMNISLRTLFPDIKGLVESLNNRIRLDIYNATKIQQGDNTKFPKQFGIHERPPNM